MTRTRFGQVAALAAVVATLAVPAAADPISDLAAEVGLAGSPVLVQLPGAITSDNMEYLGTIPVDTSGVSAEVRELDGQRLLYVSGVKGLSIYGIDDPAAPSLVGHLPLPHSQNEDMQVSADGTRAIIAADGGAPAPNPVTVGLHVIDTSDPTAPRHQAWLDEAGGGSNHTAACADDACQWIYGNDGAIYHAPADAGDAEIEIVGQWFDVDDRVTSSHALNRSVHPDPETGEPVTLMISDSEPRLVMDATDPADPVLLTSSDPADHEGDGFLQHNNLRPNAEAWTPRPDDGTATDASDPFGGHLRPGELVIGNSESNLVPQCDDGSGGLTTFSIRDFDRGVPMEAMHTFRPVNGDWADGNPGINALGCSGHWFDIQDGDDLIAASWYEHGVKVIEVLPDYSMQEVGFFQPVAGSAGAATWVVDDGDEYIISADYARGVDILRFDRDAPQPTEDDLRRAWAVGAAAVQPLADAERAFCRLGAGVTN